MNATSSTIPAAKAALVDLLESVVEWPEPRPQVCYGWPDGPEREHVVVDDTRTGAGERVWSQLGARTRDETYALGLWVVVERPGDHQQEATERAFELFAALERALIERPQLGPVGAPVPGVTVVALAQPEHTEERLTEGAQLVGRACVIESAVRVQAQIRRLP